MNAFDIGKNIRIITRNIKKSIDKGLKDFDISEGQFEYFMIISKNNGINQRELSEMMHVSKAGVTKAIRKLLSAGVIMRVKDESDLRNYGLYITEEGKKLAKRFEGYETRIGDIMFRDISDEEVETLYSIIARMKANSLKL